MSGLIFSPLGIPPNGWKLVHLRDITIKIGSGATPTGGQETYLSQRVRFALIRSQNVYDRKFDETGLAFLTDEQAQDLANVVLIKGDILLNITGDGITFSRSCIVPENVLPAVVNQHVSIIRVDETLVYPGYILSYLTHPSIKKYIESFNAGGSRRAITKGHIESFVIPLPPLPIQHRIAHILETIWKQGRSLCIHTDRLPAFGLRPNGIEINEPGFKNRPCHCLKRLVHLAVELDFVIESAEEVEG